jgi:hypothetical protein
VDDDSEEIHTCEVVDLGALLIFLQEELIHGSVTMDV